MTRTLYFYSIPNSTIPSPYFSRLPKLLADVSKKGITKFTVWQGSHEAPIPIETSKAWIEPQYPIDPSTECSAAALEKVDAARIKAAVAAEYASRPLGATADEIAAILIQRGQVPDILSVRPRVSDLKRDRILIPTGDRRGNAKGNGCAVLIHRMYWKGVL